jgi:hypothetical protein
MKITKFFVLMLAVLLVFGSAMLVVSCNDDTDPSQGAGSGSGSGGSGEGTGGSGEGSGGSSEGTSGSGEGSGGSGEGTGGSGEGEGGANTSLTYEEYLAMTPTQRSEYYNSFEDPKDYFDWFKKAKKEYDDAQDRIKIGEGGNIDLGGGN